MAKYEQARRDFEFLETLAELDDQVELDAQREALMRSPTKAFAAKMYEAAILLWLAENGSYFSSYPKVRAICDRVGVT